MDALQSCARKYAELCGYTYDCTIARKNARVSLTFSFSAYEFRHLAGLHRLKHPRLQTNSERLSKDILAGKIILWICGKHPIGKRSPKSFSAD